MDCGGGGGGGSDLGLKDAELLSISPVVGEFEYRQAYTLTATVKSDNVSAWIPFNSVMDGSNAVRASEALAETINASA